MLASEQSLTWKTYIHSSNDPKHAEKCIILQVTTEDDMRLPFTILLVPLMVYESSSFLPGLIFEATPGRVFAMEARVFRKKKRKKLVRRNKARFLFVSVP